MTKKSYTDEKLLIGNCLDTLKTLPDNSIDSVVTDPPYELGFMGKSWDNTGIAFNVAVWQECMRVLKPGGHLLAFSGSRTYHRMAVAIEDAGFEIRDQIMWVYGSGFPKSMAIDKAIDKAAGAEREVISSFQRSGRSGGILGKESEITRNITEPSTKEAKQWQGWGTALKPAHEPIVVARKPISMKTVAENVLTYGTGAINIDASRVGTREDEPQFRPSSASGIGNGGVAYGTRDGQDATYTQGRFPANVILSHNPDCQEISEATLQSELPTEVKGGIWQKGTGNGKPAGNTYTDTPAVYNCTEGCPFLEFPDTTTGGGNKNSKTSKAFFGNMESNSDYDNNYLKDTGTAARFFYCAKASKSERNAGLDGLPAKVTTIGAEGHKINPMTGKEVVDVPRQNFHPTVKPLTLMRYLIKLVTPPNGTVLDPFLGSGTTAVAAVLEDFEWKGCEMTDDYLPIIKGRLDWAVKEKKKEQPKLL